MVRLAAQSTVLRPTCTHTDTRRPSELQGYLRAVLRLGQHLQEPHDWLGLRYQRADSVDDSSELLAGVHTYGEAHLYFLWVPKDYYWI